MQTLRHFCVLALSSNRGAFNAGFVCLFVSLFVRDANIENMLIPVFLLPSCDTSSWMTQLESLFCYVTESKPFIPSQLEYVRKIASAAVQTRDHMRSDKPFNVERVRISSEEGVGGGGGSSLRPERGGGCVRDPRRARSARFESAISHFTLGQPPVLSLTRSH